MAVHLNQSQTDVLNSDQTGLYERKKQGLHTDEKEKALQAEKKRREELKTKLKRKKNGQGGSQKASDNKNKKLDEILEERQELRKAFNIRSSSNRPRIEKNQQLLLKTILDIAMHGSGSHDKRQNDIY